MYTDCKFATGIYGTLLNLFLTKRTPKIKLLLNNRLIVTNHRTVGGI